MPMTKTMIIIHRPHIRVFVYRIYEMSTYLPTHGLVNKSTTTTTTTMSMEQGTWNMNIELNFTLHNAPQDYKNTVIFTKILHIPISFTLTKIHSASTEKRAEKNINKNPVAASASAAVPVLASTTSQTQQRAATKKKKDSDI